MDQINCSMRAWIFATFLLIPSVACAQWYVGAGFGGTNTEWLPTFDPSAGESIDDQDTASKIFVGLGITPNLAIEADLTKLNSIVKVTSPGQSTEVKADALGLSLIGKLSVHPNAHMFGRLGVGRWDADLIVNAASASGTGTGTLIGAGIAYRIPNTQFDLRLEWTQYQNVGQGVSTANTRLTGQNVDVLWFSLAYHIQRAPGP
jgi:opacity protein-like surface antigen